jgi:hypothetical protein
LNHLFQLVVSTSSQGEAVADEIAKLTHITNGEFYGLWVM